MPVTSYTYTIGQVIPGPPDITILPNGVSVPRLEIEIRESPSITKGLWGVSQDGDTVKIEFKAALDQSEETSLQLLLQDHSGLPLPEPYTSEGIPYVALYGPDNKVQLVGTKGKEFVLVSHDFCNPTSWFYGSKRVTETLTNPSGDGVTWVSQNKNWIDLHSGLINDEEQIVLDQRAANVADPHGYRAVIDVGGTVLSERPRWASDFSSGGDYWIDHAAGIVYLASPAASAPTATYSYAQGSSWVLEPKPGKRIQLTEARVQFALDLVMNASIVQLVEAPDGAGGWVTVNRVVYKSFWQFATEAKGVCPTVPAVSGSPVYRGTNGQQLVKMSFKYEAVKELASSTGARMRIFLTRETLNGDGTVSTPELAEPLTGSHASVTFVGLSEDE